MTLKQQNLFYAFYSETTNWWSLLRISPAALKGLALFRKDFKNKYSPFFYRRENKDHSEMLLNDLYIFMTFRSYRFKYALINLYACQRFPLFNFADLQSSSPSDYIKMYVSLGK